MRVLYFILDIFVDFLEWRELHNFIPAEIIQDSDILTIRPLESTHRTKLKSLGPLVSQLVRRNTTF